MSTTLLNHYLWLYHIPLFALNNILTASPLISATHLPRIRVSCLQGCCILPLELLLFCSLCGAHSSSRHLQSIIQGVNVLGTTFTQWGLELIQKCLDLFLSRQCWTIGLTHILSSGLTIASNKCYIIVNVAHLLRCLNQDVHNKHTGKVQFFFLNAINTGLGFAKS